jgi:GNAT superfamily N-acetyltransferase
MLMLIRQAIVDLDLLWCKDAHQAEELGLFFASNVQADYISHSELQSTRAADEKTWVSAVDLETTNEISSRVHETKGKVPAGRDAKPIMVARVNEKLVGLAMVSFFPNANVPYAIVEDLVVMQDNRGHGIGKRMLQWIMDEAMRVGCVRAILESATRNASALECFEREGFGICSVVMMKELAPPARHKITPLAGL